MSFIELKNITVGYTEIPALRNITVRLEEGEIVTLVGANGAGKSTLVKTISGLLIPAGGAVLFKGEDISRLSPADRIHRGIVHIPEGRQIFAGMTVSENLALGAYSVVEDVRRERQLRYVLELFPFLRDRLGDIAGNFSGGQQQLLAIARGLMSDPRVLLLDEPSLGVAPLLVAEIFKLISRLRSEGLTILLAEQNARQALAVADRGYVFENGMVSLQGSAKDLLNSHEVAEKYLGIDGHIVGGITDGADKARLLRQYIW
jgi:branched-chain amino acid transport system ATP-binding protein